MLTDSTVRLLSLAIDSAIRPTPAPNDSLGAITLAITSVEHFINYVPESVKFSHQIHTGSLSQIGRTDGFLILQELNDKRSNIRIRISTLCFLLSGFYPDNGSETFQHLNFAIDIRNEIIHLTPRIQDPAKMPAIHHPPWVKRLKEKKILCDDVDWFTASQIAEKPEVAKWVVKSVIHFFDHLGSLNEKDHFLTGIFHPDSIITLYKNVRKKLV